MGSEQCNGVPAFVSLQGNTRAGTPRENVGDDADPVDGNLRVASRDEDLHERTTENTEPMHTEKPLLSYFILCVSSLCVLRVLCGSFTLAAMSARSAGLHRACRDA